MYPESWTHIKQNLMKGVNFMPKGKRMYSPELKYEIVQKYLNGDGSLKSLANEYHVDHQFFCDD